MLKVETATHVTNITKSMYRVFVRYDIKNIKFFFFFWYNLDMIDLLHLLMNGKVGVGLTSSITFRIYFKYFFFVFKFTKMSMNHTYYAYQQRPQSPTYGGLRMIYCWQLILFRRWVPHMQHWLRFMWGI